MPAKWKDRLALQLDRLRFRDDDEIFLYLMTHVAALLCLLVHIYLLIVFAIYGNSLFLWVNAGSCALYLFFLTQARRRRYVATGLLISVEVSLYVLLFSCTAGTSSYILAYLLLVVVMQMAVPYGSNLLRIGVVAGVLVSAAACVAADFAGLPAMVFPQGLQRLLLASNVVIMFLGVTLELQIGNMIRSILRRMEETKISELSSQAHTDALTGLYNRRYADLYFEKLRAGDRGADRGYCVAMVDIDDFKVVNDTYGHGVGDEILQFLSSFLQKNLRKSEVVFRWGGEEFLIVLEGVELATAAQVLDKLRARIAAYAIPTKAGELRITITVGVSALDPQHREESIEGCDRNLYHGKRSGKNKVVYHIDHP